jgi:predicted esterase
MRTTPGPPPRPRRPSQSVYLRRRVAVFGGIPAALALIIYLATASGGGTPSSTTTTSTTATVRTSTGHATTTHEITVGVRTMAMLDASRTTYSYVTGKTTSGRHLKVEIRYPTLAGSPAHETSDARPDFHDVDALIVFAPGYRLRPNDYAYLLDGWVRAGFVVAAVEFPDTSYPASEAPYAANLPYGTPESDQYNEPRDIAFVVDHLVADEQTASSWLHRAFDPTKVALAGHSDGAAVVSALIYDSNDAVSGLPVGAVLALSGGEFPISNQHYGAAGSGVPLLVVQSAADTCAVPYEAVNLYDAVGEPKYLLELDAASHLGAYNGSDPSATVVARVTTTFLKAAFSKTGVANDATLLTLGAHQGLTAITDDSLAAPIATPTGNSGGACPHD